MASIVQQAIGVAEAAGVGGPAGGQAEEAAAGGGAAPPAAAAAPAGEPVRAQEQPAIVGKLNKILKGTRSCMLTTKCPDGSLHARPMSTAGIDWERGKGEHIFFVTDKGSVKVEEIAADPSIALVFSNDAKHTWATLSARAEVIEDPARARELWSPLFNAYFPGGPEAGNVVLIKATLAKATFWEGSAGARMQIALAGALAKLTGKPIHPNVTQKSQSIVFP